MSDFKSHIRQVIYRDTTVEAGAICTSDMVDGVNFLAITGTDALGECILVPVKLQLGTTNTKLEQGYERVHIGQVKVYLDLAVSAAAYLLRSTDLFLEEEEVKGIVENMTMTFNKEKQELTEKLAELLDGRVLTQHDYTWLDQG